MKKLMAYIAMFVILAFAGLSFGAVVYSRMNKDVATGNGAINTTVAPGVPWRLDSVRIHLNGVGTAASLVATLNAVAGGPYDAIVWSQDMTSVTDLIWFPARNLLFTSGDELTFAWANGSGKTFGLEIYYTKLNN